MRGRPRFNVTDVAEIRRLAHWYEAIADDYASALMRRSMGRSQAATLRTLERDARRRAAQLRAKVADR